MKELIQELEADLRGTVTSMRQELDQDKKDARAKRVASLSAAIMNLQTTVTLQKQLEQLEALS